MNTTPQDARRVIALAKKYEFNVTVEVDETSLTVSVDAGPDAGWLNVSWVIDYWTKRLRRCGAHGVEAFSHGAAKIAPDTMTAILDTLRSFHGRRIR